MPPMSSVPNMAVYLGIPKEYVTSKWEEKIPINDFSSTVFCEANKIRVHITLYHIANVPGRRYLALSRKVYSKLTFTAWKLEKQS